jgi:hypothetical protein
MLVVLSDTSTHEDKEELCVVDTGSVFRGKLYLPYKVTRALNLQEGDIVEYVEDIRRPGRIYIRKAKGRDRNKSQIKRMGEFYR